MLGIDVGWFLIFIQMNNAVACLKLRFAGELETSRNVWMIPDKGEIPVIFIKSRDDGIRPVGKPDVVSQIDPPMTKSVSARENMAMSRNLRRRLRIMRPPPSDDIPLRFAGCSGWRPAPASFFADKKRKSIPVVPPVSVEVDRKRHRRRMCFPRCALKAVFRLKGVLPRG